MSVSSRLWLCPSHHHPKPFSQIGFSEIHIGPCPTPVRNPIIGFSLPIFSAWHVRLARNWVLPLCPASSSACPASHWTPRNPIHTPGFSMAQMSFLLPSFIFFFFLTKAHSCLKTHSRDHLLQNASPKPQAGSVPSACSFVFSPYPHGGQSKRLCELLFIPARWYLPEQTLYHSLFCPLASSTRPGKSQASVNVCQTQAMGRRMFG